jgi:hypothetical protein
MEGRREREGPEGEGGGVGRGRGRVGGREEGREGGREGGGGRCWPSPVTDYDLLLSSPSFK